MEGKRISITAIIGKETRFTLRLRRMVKAIIKEKSKCNPPGSTFLPEKHQSLPVKCMWLAVLSSCLVLFAYQTYDRVAYYFTYPVAVDVLITKESYQTFPDLTICAQETEELIKLKKKLKLNKCSFYPIDVLLIYAENISMDEIWSHVNTSTTVDSAMAINTTEADRTPLEFTESPLILGLCTIFKTSSRKPLMTHGGRFEIIQKLPRLPGCHERYASWIYFTDPDEIIFTRKRQLMMMAGQKITFSLTLTQVEFVNRTSSICISSKDYAKCVEDCYVKYIENNCECRLPPHPHRISKKMCRPSQQARKCTRNMRKYWKGSDTQEQCSCKRKCIHRVLDVQLFVEVAGENDVVVELYIEDPYETVVKERLLYGLIPLLSDIGGNSGLSVGLSVLSLFEIAFAVFPRHKVRQEFSYRDPLFRIAEKMFKKYNSESKAKGEVIVKIFKGGFFSLIWKICNVVNISLFLLGVAFRIQEFLQHPSLNILEVSFNETMIPPAMIFCPIDERLKDLKYQYAGLNNISDVCDVKIWELFDLPGINASYIWMNPKLTGLNESYTRKHWLVTIHDGTCIEFDEGITGQKAVAARSSPGRNKGEKGREETTDGRGELIEGRGDGMGGKDRKEKKHKSNTTEEKRRKSDVNMLGKEPAPTSPKFEMYFMPVQEPICGIEDMKVYVKSPNQHLDYTLFTYIGGDIYHQIGYVVKEFKTDKERNPCIPEIEHESCKIACLHDKLISQIKCKLPYMPKMNKPTCDSSTSAKHSHLKYLELFVSPDSTKDCNCLPPCVKHLYDIQIIAVQWRWTTVLFRASENIIIRYMNIPADSFVKLLCDIGGWLGSTLGLCIFTTFQMMLVSGLRLKQRILKPGKLKN